MAIKEDELPLSAGVVGGVGAVAFVAGGLRRWRRVAVDFGSDVFMLYSPVLTTDTIIPLLV
jgi:hypothetical protein